MSVGLAVELEGAAGGTGVATGFARDVLSVVLDRPLPPGAPALLRVGGLARPLDVEGRVVGIRRAPDGRFAAGVRLVNLRREDRELLAAALA